MTVPVTLIAVLTAPPRPVNADAIIGLCYVGTFSMCIGFFAWYRAMAIGGVAKIGMLQLAQPALTLAWSALLLGEPVSWLTAVAAAGVIGATAIGRNARVDVRVHTEHKPLVLTRADDPSNPSAVLARVGDPPEPPAVLPRPAVARQLW